MGKRCVAVFLFVLCLLSIPALSTRLEAGANIVEIQGIAYNVNASMADNLKAFVGKVVYVTLDSGATFTGNIKAVGAHLVHVEKLQGKEFFDALVAIDRICAIDTRFRDYQR